MARTTTNVIALSRNIYVMCIIFELATTAVIATGLEPCGFFFGFGSACFRLTSFCLEEEKKVYVSHNVLCCVAHCCCTCHTQKNFTHNHTQTHNIFQTLALSRYVYGIVA